MLRHKICLRSYAIPFAPCYTRFSTSVEMSGRRRKKYEDLLDQCKHNNKKENEKKTTAKTMYSVDAFIDRFEIIIRIFVFSISTGLKRLLLSLRVVFIWSSSLSLSSSSSSMSFFVIVNYCFFYASQSKIQVLFNLNK